MAVFFTYDLTSFEITDVFPTQALANAEAARVPTKGAYAGSTDIDDVQPDGNWFYFTEAPIVRPQPRNTYPVRRAFQAWHNRLHELSALLRIVGPDYPQWAVDISHDMLFNLHRGAYMVWNDARLNAAQKVQWLQQSALGPNDAVGGVALYDRDHPETIFPILAAVWEGAADQDARNRIRANVQKPMSVVQVVNSEGDVAIARRTLNEMIHDVSWYGSATPPTVAQLNAGDWIAAINA